MTPKARRFLIIAILAAIVLAVPVALLDYVLPHHDVLRITGSEVRRVDNDSNANNNEQPGATRDVFFIFAEDPDTKEPHVFRNEDTGWGFPWYFKFNSADVQGTAQSIAGERGVALFTYYGWRIRLMSMMPNVTAITRVDADYVPIPWFNLTLLVLVGAAVLWLVLRIRRGRKRRRLAEEAKAAELRSFTGGGDAR